MDYIERNTVWGFNERVRKNLKVVNSARDNGSNEAHVVTQLITSLLGLIVFPYAKIKERGDTSLKNCKLQSLSADGWPTWTFKIGSSDDLDDLVRHLRNATSHWGLYFFSDSRKLEEVEIQFSDRPNRPKNAPFNWRATINAAELQNFVLRFADLLKTKEYDNS
jgi:hypothetical protein